jgi:hypothetical protein
MAQNSAPKTDFAAVDWDFDAQSLRSFLRVSAFLVSDYFVPTQKFPYMARV